MLEHVLGLVLSLLAPPLCVGCRAYAGPAAPLCAECRAALGGARLHAGCWCAFPYDGPAGAVVRELKFGARTALADFMAASIVAGAPPGLVDGTIVPVPPHAGHRRRRGIDHAAALARALSGRTGMPVLEALVRAAGAGAQVGRARAERLDHPRGEIAVREGAGVPERVLLVDDVVTTGATLGACAAALSAAGAARIACAAYAWTPGR